jgi:pimeloyl-ACP methyl ester carboxylesterase
MSGASKTILLIHGLWMTPTSWNPFLKFYKQRGYRVLAPAWPRMQGTVEQIRQNPSKLAGLGLLEIAEHYEKIVRSLDERPILIGHSMGGLIVQILLDRGLGAAGVSINGTAPKGIYRLPLSVIKAASPVLSNPLNFWRCVMLTFEQFRYAFANNMSEHDAKADYEREVIPGPGRPIFQTAFANFTPMAATDVDHTECDRAPLLLIVGTEDLLVPPILNRINYELYRYSAAVTEYKEFSNRSHLIIAQEGWEEVADFVLSWAVAQNGAANVREQPPETGNFTHLRHALTNHDS